jgi:hypothetical protein
MDHKGARTVDCKVFQTFFYLLDDLFSLRWGQIHVWKLPSTADTMLKEDE